MEEIIKTDHRAIIRQCVDWIHLVQDTYQWHAAANKVISIRFPYDEGIY
jgi:hypothetical protein